MEDMFIIENPYLIRRLEEIKHEMLIRNMINPEPRLSEDDRFIATLISLYEATKDLVSKK